MSSLCWCRCHRCHSHHIILAEKSLTIPMIKTPKTMMAKKHIEKWLLYRYDIHVHLICSVYTFLSLLYFSLFFFCRWFRSSISLSTHHHQQHHQQLQQQPNEEEEEKNCRDFLYRLYFQYLLVKASKHDSMFTFSML